MTPSNPPTSRVGEVTEASPRIIMFAPLCYPPANSEAIVNAKLVRAMLRAGWHVDVISDPKTLHWYPVDGTWADLEGAVHKVPASPPTVAARLRAGANALRHAGCLGRYPSWAVPAFEAARDLVKRRPYDFILSRAVPDTAHFPALMLHRHTGLPWIANWNDPQPQAMSPPPYGSGPSSRVSRRDRVFYRAIARDCSWHTFPCERLRRYMCAYLPGSPESRASVIPHVAAMRDRPRAVTRRDVFTICHAGYLKPPRDVHPLLEGARLFMRGAGISRGLRLQFVADQGDGIENAARELDLSGLVEVRPATGYAEVGAILEAADVLAIVEADLEEGIYFPSKFVDYVQAGRPILALSPSRGTLADVLGAHGGGLAVDCASPGAIAAAIGVLHAHWRQGTLDSSYGSSRLADLFSEQTVLDAYRDLFRRLSRTNCVLGSP